MVELRVLPAMSGKTRLESADAGSSVSLEDNYRCKSIIAWRQPGKVDRSSVTSPVAMQAIEEIVLTKLV